LIDPENYIDGFRFQLDWIWIQMKISLDQPGSEVLCEPTFIRVKKMTITHEYATKPTKPTGLRHFPWQRRVWKVNSLY
jgi:hypothetical protein